MVSGSANNGYFLVYMQHFDDHILDCDSDHKLSRLCQMPHNNRHSRPVDYHICADCGERVWSFHGHVSSA